MEIKTCVICGSDLVYTGTQAVGNSPAEMWDCPNCSEIDRLKSQKTTLLAACEQSLKYIDDTKDYLPDNDETPRITELLKSAIEQAEIKYGIYSSMKTLLQHVIDGYYEATPETIDFDWPDFINRCEEIGFKPSNIDQAKEKE